MPRKSTRKTTHRVSRTHAVKRSRSSTTRRSSTSASRSLQARRQRRRSDGTFAKGFKTHASPKKSTTVASRSKTGTSKTKTRTASSGSRKGTGRRSGIKKGYTPKMHAVENSFDFKCNSRTKDNVIKAVSENFSAEEIKKIDSQGKPIVTNNIPKGKEGGYKRVTTNDKGSVPSIDLKTNSDETTITHEVLHHLRTVDKDRSGYAKTAYPVDSKGVSEAKKYMGKSIHNNISNSEETATAAETEIRTRTPGHVSVYWNLDKHSISGKETRDHDRAVMRSNGAVKEGDNATGKKAVKMVNENYPKTQVQSRKVGGESALDTFKKIFHLRSKHKW